MTVLILLGCQLLQGAAHAQDETPEALFRRGTIMFRQQRFIPARLDFNQVLSRHPDNEWAPAAAMMLAKTFFAMSEYDEARATANTLSRNYPRSRYTEWTTYLLAACDFREGNLDSTIERLAELAADTVDSGLQNRAFAALKYAILPAAGTQAVHDALDAAGIPHSALDEATPAPVAELSTEFDTLAPAPSWQQRNVLKIGLLAPLSGINADLGINLKAGVEAVLDGQPPVRGKRIELVVEDTGSDPVRAIIGTKSLIEQGVIAIIGPVMSESNFGPAALADEHGIPFLAPTTTNPNFTTIGTHVFQLNQNPEVQAAALAGFAADVAEFRNFAVIASNDPWGEAVAETFAEHMKQAGADEIFTGYYNAEGLANNHDILMNIRNRAPESTALIDSVVVLNPGSPFPDTLFVRQDQAPRGERMLGPINSIDCILISATSAQAVQIASQIMEYHINTVLLGDSGWWSNEPILVSGSKYIDGAFLVAPAGELSGGRGATSIKTGIGSEPSVRIPFMRGADAASVLLHCFESGALDPAAVTESLRMLDGFIGISSRISIAPENRMNRAVDFVRVRGTQYEPVDLSRPDLLRMQLHQRFFEDSYLTPDMAPVP